MLHIYGSPLSSPTNKVRFVANYLKMPSEFHIVNLSAGENRTPEFLKINSLGKIPAINDDGFTLAESNAIVRYLCDKNHSTLYPKELKARAVVDQWIDYASQHVMLALARIMFNTYFYKVAGANQDERSLQDGRKFINTYLPLIEQQLTRNAFIAGSTMTLADIVMIAALDTIELCEINMSTYTHINTWRKKLMSESFYQDCHESYASSFNKMLGKIFNKVT